MNIIEHYPYDSWNEFKANLIPELFSDNIFQEGKYLFRGHCSSDWQLTPSYDRFNYPCDKFQSLIEMFKNECVWLNIDNTILNDYKCLVAFSQHYGIPTRLLDWTYSPYIASFFAFSNLILQKEVKGNISVWILNTKCGIWSRDLGVEIIKIPSIGNVRIRNQNGCFTLSNTKFKSLEEYVISLSKKCNDWALRKCTIPSNEYLKAITDLNSMGINWSKVFPGIEGSAASSFLNWKCQMLKEYFANYI